MERSIVWKKAYQSNSIVILKNNILKYETMAMNWFCIFRLNRISIGCKIKSIEQNIIK